MSEASAASKSAGAHGEGRRLRVLLGAFGDPGHAFPMLALGSRLVERGHEVWFQTWRKWQLDVEAAGMRFAAAPEYQVFPTRERPLKPYEAAVRAARETLELVTGVRPDVCVSDIITLAPALAAEVSGVPVATLVPHVLPDNGDDRPPYSLGARAPATPLGRAFWRAFTPLARGGLERGRRDYNDARIRLGLAPRTELHTGLSRELTLVATLPHLEYPRAWPRWVRVVGPLVWEPPGEEVRPPDGTGPVVLVAPSTAQDREHALLRAALDGLAGEAVRVIATYNGREPEKPLRVPQNAVLVPWLSYTKTMPHCDAVVLHGGHGTLVRALTEGCVPVVCPAGGDMGENAARVAWAGFGVRLPRRLLSAATVRLAVARALDDERARTRVHAVKAWAAAHDGGDLAAREIERWAASGRRAEDPPALFPRDQPTAAEPPPKPAGAPPFP